METDGKTELLARAVDVMMAQAKIIYILIITVNKLFSFFRQGVRKHVLRVSIELKNTRESLGELEKLWNTRLWLVFPQHFSFFQTSTRSSIKQLDYSLEISIA